MKTFSFILIAMALCFGFSAKAQISNPGFETWLTEETHFSYIPFVLEDTFTVTQPTGWTTSNSVTMHQQVGQKAFVSQANEGANGGLSAKMVTDSFTVQLNGSDPLKLTLPGFMANGRFQINLGDLLLSSQCISPTLLKGAGEPINKKLGKLKALVKYAPVTGDSLLIWAVLKKQGAVVGEAKLISRTAYANFTWIEADFAYFSCDLPDSLVILAASSYPDFTGILGGESGLNPGSVLLLDSLATEDLPNGFQFPPIAADDLPFTTKNKTISFNPLENDHDCNGLALNIVSATTPQHGSVQVMGGQSLEYTPENNYAGVDTFYYTISNGSATAKAMVKMSVYALADADDILTSKVCAYPNPTDDILFLETNNVVPRDLTLSNLAGQTIPVYLSAQPIDDRYKLSLAGLPSGCYTLKFKLGEQTYQRFVIKN